MKKQLFLSVITMVFALHLKAQDTLAGVISSDTTLLLANSPYIVTDDLTIPHGVKVVVEPGVVFKIDMGVELWVNGEFQAIGNDSAVITFTDIMLSWADIIFTDSSIDYDEATSTGCILDHCIIEEGHDNAVIHIWGCAPKISNCEIRYSVGNQVIDMASKGNPEIINNKIHDFNGSFGPFFMNFHNDPGSGMALIKGNEIYNCNGAPQLIQMSQAIFTDNYIHDCNTTIGIGIYSSVILNNNRFENLPEAAVVILGGPSIIKCNTFRNNKINFVMTCDSHPIILNNNLWNYQDWNFLWSNYSYLGNLGGSGCFFIDSTYATIDFSNNYWGGLTNAQMDSSIWDYNDDTSLKALIAYTPAFPDSVNFSTADCSYPNVGINEVHASNDDMIEIYPNPFHDMSYIKIKSILLNEKYKVVIFDSYGRMVRQIQVTNPERIQVSRDGLASGMYAYQLISPEKKVYSGKFIVE